MLSASERAQVTSVCGHAAPAVRQPLCDTFLLAQGLQRGQEDGGSGQGW